MTHFGAPINQVIAGVITITMIAVRFTFRSMLPSRCQLLSNGPKERCSRNQRSSLAEERAKAKAATSRNGVVGSNGNTTPTAPIATAIRPTSSHKNFILVITAAVHHTITHTGKLGRHAASRPTFQPVDSFQCLRLE